MLTDVAHISLGRALEPGLVFGPLQEIILHLPVKVIMDSNKRNLAFPVRFEEEEEEVL